MMLVVYFLPFLTAFAVAQDCTLCPNGKSPNRTKGVPLGIGIFTCGDLELAAKQRGNDDECSLIQSHAAFCECPSSCTLCPNGGVADASRMVNGKTCGELEYKASIMSLDECLESRQYAAACCGGACASICPDGSSLLEEKIDTVVGTMSDGTIQTCGDIQASIENEQDLERCHDYYQIGVHSCGCNASSLPEPKCTLCENDGEAPRNMLLNVGRGNLCFEFMAYLANEEDQDSCTAFQATAGIYCGCDNDVSSESACRICDNDILPDPARVPDVSTGFSCAELEYAANTPQGDCSMIQAIFHPSCCGPEIVDPNDTDGLPYADDTYIDATAPPIVRPTEATAEEEMNGGFDTSSANVLFIHISLVAFMSILVVIAA